MQGATPDMRRIPVAPITSRAHAAAPRISLQRKLAIGATNDPLEHEADRVADRVMRMPDPAAIHSTTGAVTNTLQRKCSVSAAPQSAAAPPIVHEVLCSAGQPLDHATRTFFEPRLGHDLSGVRTHTDSRAAQSAAAVDALAYTSGRDIVFSNGQYSPGTASGQRLLAHELAHVAQQERSQTAPSVQRQPAISPTKFLESTSDIVEFPAENEAAMDKLILQRQNQDSPDKKGKYLGTVAYKHVPDLNSGKTKKENEDFALARRAVKKALLDVIVTDITKKNGTEMRVRVPLDKSLAMIDHPFAMIVLRFDQQRNVEVELAGTDVQKFRPAGNPSVIIGELEKAYGITFVSDSITAKLPGATKSETFAGKPWEGDDAVLVQQALPLLGTAEKAILNGCRLRRLAAEQADGAAGFFDTGDRSVNLMNSALPDDKTLWFGEGGKFYSRGVFTVLHEIGHALHFAPAPAGSPKGTKVNLDLFQKGVRDESKKRTKKDPGSKFPPPGITVPTDYGRNNWFEFYADTFAIYKTNPSFLKTPEFQYLYDLFNAQFP
jgi:hypothetical protein